eukprot:TRINITY_DN12694_c0_g1_i4.p1 TRINITY_DN12694_c0_g1~~TRINITY_DN12694_c0_g1_i4.p1  ORF type:complete len:689 (+),score=161.47 TRINITY_DN12694_c0_g1_i4:532-2598(+)
MAIIKSGLKASRIGGQSQTQSNSSTDDGLKTKYLSEKQEDSGRESDTTDDMEIAEVGAELVMVGGQTCSIPYELFDLPDLKQILSLDTWNNLLTDEERYQLTAYLPDMDQQTFSLTLKQLLEGETMHFSSPMDELFKRLKGGLCPPEVVRYRETLQHVQRKEYYHHLRKYHNNMVNTFTEMQNLWKECNPRTGIDKKLAMWYTRKNNSLLPGFQPALTYGEPIVGSVKKSRSAKPFVQGGKVLKNLRAQNPTAVTQIPYQDKSLTTARVDAKGVLKVKSSAKSPFPTDKGPFPTETNNAKVDPKETFKVEKRTPRGVLKVNPSLSVRNEQSQLRSDAVSSVEAQGNEMKLKQSLHLQDPRRWESEMLGDTPAPFKGKDGRKAFVFGAEEGQLSQQKFENPYSLKYPMPSDKKTKKGKGHRVASIPPRLQDCYVQDSQDFDNETVGGKPYMDFPETCRFPKDTVAYQEDYLGHDWRHMDRQSRPYNRNTIEHYSEVERATNAHPSFSHNLVTQSRDLDLEATGKSYGEYNKQKGVEKSRKRHKDVKPSTEDNFRFTNEHMLSNDDFREKQGYSEGQSKFSGIRRPTLESQAFHEDKKWFSHGKFINEPKRQKHGQVGSSNLGLEQRYEEPVAFEDAYVSKRHKKKRDNAKSVSMEPVQPQQPLDKQKTPKLKFKNPKAPEPRIESNGLL